MTKLGEFVVWMSMNEKYSMTKEESRMFIPICVKARQLLKEEAQKPICNHDNVSHENENYCKKCGAKWCPSFFPKPTADKGLVEELRKEIDTWMDTEDPDVDDVESCYRKVDEILSRYAPQEQSDDGLREDLKKLVDGWRILGYIACASNLDEIISRHQSQPEQKHVTAGLSEFRDRLRTIPIPYEDYAKVRDCLDEFISHHPASPVQEESLAELADRKGLLKVEYRRTFHSGLSIEFWGDKIGPQVVFGNTYAEAESKARAYLASLPDCKGEGK